MMRLLTVLALLLPPLIILLVHPRATTGEVDAAGGSCRKPGEDLPGSHMTDDCSVRIDDVGDRASEGASDGGRRGADEWQRERDEGRNEDPKIKFRGRNVEEEKGRQDKSEKERGGGGGRKQGELGQLKERDDEKSKLTDKHRKKEKKEKKKKRDEKTSYDEEKKFHKKDKKNRNDRYGKKDKRKKDKGNKNYEDKQWHKFDDEKHRKNKKKEHNQKENHSKKDYDKKRKDQRAIEKERRDMTSGNHKKQGKNNKYDENIGKDEKKLKETQSQKTVELTKENEKEEKTNAVAEEHGTREAAAGGGTRSKKAKRDDLLVDVQGSDECDTNNEEENVALGDQDEGGISVNDEDVKGNEGEFDGLGGYVKPFTRVSFGNGMFVDLEVDSAELLLQDNGTKDEGASEAKVPETPDQEGITDGKDNNQKLGRDGEYRKAEEDVDHDGREGKTYEKGEGEGDQVEADGQAGQRDNVGGLDPVASRMLEETEAPQRQETNSNKAPVMGMANRDEEADKSG